MAGGAFQGQDAAQSAPLEAGDALGVSLVTGDLEFAGTGTVTKVDGNQVFAFGHPFLTSVRPNSR
jgi:hypothetical protein